MNRVMFPLQGDEWILDPEKINRGGREEAQRIDVFVQNDWEVEEPFDGVPIKGAEKSGAMTEVEALGFRDVSQGRGSVKFSYPTHGNTYSGNPVV